MFIGSAHCQFSRSPHLGTLRQKKKKSVSVLGSFYIVDLLARELVVIVMALPALTVFVGQYTDCQSELSEDCQRALSLPKCSFTGLLFLAYNFY